MRTIELNAGALTEEMPESEPLAGTILDASDGYPDDHCQTCRGQGVIRSARWGARDCPEPYETCPDCMGGEGY